MSNPCYNVVTIEAETEKGANEIMLAMMSNQSVFDFAKLVPYPGNSANEIMWRIKNWGTMNREHEPLMRSIASSTLRYFFDTDNSPCDPICLELARRFPTAKILHEYEEGENDFSGYAVYGNGELLWAATGSFGEYKIDGTDYSTLEDEDE